MNFCYQTLLGGEVFSRVPDCTACTDKTVLLPTPAARSRDQGDPSSKDGKVASLKRKDSARKGS